MQQTVIDTFIVPEESKAAFLAQARKVQTFIKTLPGFVEGFVYELKGDGSRYNFMTLALWESEAAIENARKSVTNEFQKWGYDPQEAARQLGVERIRAVYERTAY